jgi:Uma2 family endonuclease
VGEAQTVLPEHAGPLLRAEYDKLVESGSLADEWIELLEGVLVQLSPRGTEHADVTSRLITVLVPWLAERAIVRVHSAFKASSDSELEPDVAIVPFGDYRRAHPDRALLVIEVANKSLRNDFQVRAELYAKAGVPEYWVVDLSAYAIRVHTAPHGDRYERMATYLGEDAIPLVSWPDMAVRVSDVLPE